MFSIFSSIILKEFIYLLKILTKEDPINEDPKEDTLLLRALKNIPSRKNLEITLSLCTMQRDISQISLNNFFVAKNYEFFVMAYDRYGCREKLLLD